MRTHCAARQIDGCSNGKVEQINCTNGYADAAGVNYMIWMEILFGNTPKYWKIIQIQREVTNPFVQEHINLVSAIRTGNTINDGEDRLLNISYYHG